MIEIKNTDVFGWVSAIRGMRNPFDSWAKSDSYECYSTGGCHCEKEHYNDDGFCHNINLGENDLKLMKNLSKAGNDHAKYLRMINVTCDITAPLYWWKEFDTYKVGTVANSCSTMHTIHKKEFTLDDFSCEHLKNEWDDTGMFKYCLITVIAHLNNARRKFLETKDKEYWWQIIQLLPSSYNQKRTVQLNYQVLKNMYFARKNHKLTEWRSFCEWCETLPYFKEIING